MRFFTKIFYFSLITIACILIFAGNIYANTKQNSIVINLNSTDVSCANGNDGRITTMVSGGTGNYTYQWSSSNSFTAEVKDIENLSAGIYTLVVTDDENNSSERTITINEPQVLTMQNPTVSNISCNGNNDGSITAGSVNGGTAPYQYSINSTDFQTSPNFEQLKAGNYLLIAKDANNCIISKEFTITQPSRLYAEFPETTEVSCYNNNNNDGTLIVGNIYGGTPPFLYSVDGTNFSSSTIFENLNAGNYTLVIKDANNCILEQAFTINQPEQITSNFSKTNIKCYGGSSGSIRFQNSNGGSGNYEYSIDGINWSASNVFNNLQEGSYQLKIRDAANQNCSTTIAKNIEITEPTNPLTVTSTSTRTTFFNTPTGTATVYPSGGTPGYTYQWRIKGTSEIITTTKTAQHLNSGDYEVTIIDNNGCSEIITVKVNEILYTEILPTSVCEDNPIRISYFEILNGSAQGGVAPYTYKWDYGDHESASSYTNSGPNRVVYANDGNYKIKLTVTDAEGFSNEFFYDQYVGECFIDNCGSNDFDLGGFFIGDENGNEITIANCNDNSLKYIYILLDQNPSRYSLYTEFKYTVKSIKTGITKSYRTSNCFYEKQVIPSVAKTIPIEYTCGDEVTIENIYVKFSNKKDRSCGQSQNPKCYSTDNDQIISTPLFAEAQGYELKCYDSKLGSITVVANGGKAPYQYSITGADSGYQISSSFKILEAGDYSVWVKDSEGTIYKIPSVTITQPEFPITIEFDITQPKCAGETGSVIASATGGTPFTDTNRDPYNYIWNTPNNDTTKEVKNLKPGTYTLTVLDAYDCQAIKSFEIKAPQQLSTANAGEPISLDCGYNSIILNGKTPQVGNGLWSVVSGPNNYNFKDNTDPNTTFSGDPGLYTLRWTIFNDNCSNFKDVTIEIAEPCNTVDFDGIDDHIFLGTADFSQLQSGFTIEAWVKTISNKSIQNIIANDEYSLLLKDGSPAFKYQNNSIVTPHKLKVGKWHHISVLFDGTSYYLYVDGIQLLKTEENANFIIPTTPFLIGASQDLSNEKQAKDFFRGSIQEVRIWNKKLSENQLHFLMNQRLVAESNPLKGTILPKAVPENLSWNNLIVYLPLQNSENFIDGKIKDITGNILGATIRNTHSAQENSAPLPYIMNQRNSSWNNPSSWLVPDNAFGDNITINDVWQIPGSYGIDNTNKVNWNIIEISKSTTFPYVNETNYLQILGLFVNQDATLTMDGNSLQNDGSGTALIITDYLKLDGIIDLNGESQLVQTQNSTLDNSSLGYLTRDQKGTANSFNYNYWTSPVSSRGVNGGFTLAEVLKDATNPENILDINFGTAHTWADSKNYSGPKRISTFWLHTFQQTANNYYGWKRFNQNQLLKTGIGFSMKGTSGDIPISTKQNYTFKGLPNNGEIKLYSKPGDNFLLGNPYPSAINLKDFILDNLDKNTVANARGDKNLFNGNIYLWDHFGPRNSHYLREYVGGYATVNLIGGIPAIANNERINTTNETSEKTPGIILPIGQGFFINSTIDPSNEITISEGNITFNNSQRLFAKEFENAESVFLKPEFVEKSHHINNKDQRRKIRLNFNSPGGMRRQIIVGEDPNTTSGYDLGYDAPIYDLQKEDMYWIINKNDAMVIQGVPDFNNERILDLGVIINESKEFNIEVIALENIGEELNVYLLDKTDSTYFDLKKGNYKTILQPGEYNDTFAITFSRVESAEEPQEEETQNPEKEEPIEEGQEEEPEIPDSTKNSLGLKIYYITDENTIYIENPRLEKLNKLLIYDLKGSLINVYENIPIQEIVRYSMNHPKSTAPYLLKLYAESQIINKKIIKR
ncbi:LamG-like jellyroll fold domain-containing protein [Zunongwangia sp.]|uniref:LamG-like jellyroll fold domain-containing protein n=1 Tax=Zunongwangia sp. TaxID=1965325 RepID=UPI003AA7E8A8